MTLSQLGPYRIARELGRGNMGVVYLAQHDASPSWVAIKTLALDQAFSGATLTEIHIRFHREAQVATRLCHPHIVSVLEAAQDPPTQLVYMVMEYMAGPHLQAYTQDLLPLPRVLVLVHQMALALAHAHAQGVVHRDIKPSNVLLNATHDQAKLTDFGVARISDATRTQTGLMLGTPAYMAPEQLITGQCDGRSDIYALGVVLYQLITGRLPYSSQHPSDLMRNIVSQNVPDIRSDRPELSAQLSHVVATALQKKPHQRYAQADHMAHDLQFILKNMASTDLSP